MVSISVAPDTLRRVTIAAGEISASGCHVAAHICPAIGVYVVVIVDDTDVRKLLLGTVVDVLERARC